MGKGAQGSIREGSRLMLTFIIFVIFVSFLLLCACLLKSPSTRYIQAVVPTQSNRHSWSPLSLATKEPSHAPATSWKKRSARAV